MAFAIAATLCAAALVLYFQYRAISELQAQTRVILRQGTEQTAADIATDLRHTLDGPVFDTLTAVNHPDLRAGRLDLVAAQFAAGLSAYQHVDRFFAWHAPSQAGGSDDVLFYDRAGRFAPDPVLGPAILALARQHAPSQQIYVAAEHIAPASPHQVFLRLFWTDARRVQYFAVLGFVIEPSRLRAQLFDPARNPALKGLLTRRTAGLPLQLAVTDERGAVVSGRIDGTGHTTRVPFQMAFYPAEEIQSRLAAGVAPRAWHIAVSSPAAGGVRSVAQSYGPSGLAVILILLALAFTVQAQRRSAELARMQADFVAHVSHQLKTPLSLLSAATETLEMDRVRSPERFAEYLRTIHGEANRLSQLVQRVLEFSRVQQRRDYEFEDADLSTLVRETVAAFSHSLSTQRFEFDVTVEGPPPVVRADPAALEQAVVNLLDNAVKYSGAVKQVTVRVRSERGHAVIEIADRGVGIEPRDQRRIFERFYRTSGSQRPGFGLGLPIVKELIAAHGGDVEVSSTPGAGSTFSIRLPLSVEEDGHEHRAAARA